jgi:hypothetical protein
VTGCKFPELFGLWSGNSHGNGIIRKAQSHIQEDERRPCPARSSSGFPARSCDAGSAGQVDVRVFITAVPILKLFSRGEGDSGGHLPVLRETTSRGLCGLVCPSRTGTRQEPGTLT